MNDFDEKAQKSLAKIKSFIVLTENPLNDGDMKTLNAVTSGEVQVVNVALQVKTVTKPTVGKQTRLGMEELGLYISELKLQKTKKICN